MNKPLRSLESLVAAGILPAATPELEEVARQFSVSITPSVAALINPSDPTDPIVAQYVPSVRELSIHPSEQADPIGDELHSPVEGIVHRYPDRVLLKLIHTCAVYCRFCFRREQVGKDQGSLTPAQLDRALGHIREHQEIWEVILSGGDPLILSDRRLAETVSRLNEITHVKILRLHTRIPVVEPARITPQLIDALRGPKPVYILIHCNHARELTPEARSACGRLADAGFPLLSQSVLLRGVNDDPQTLTELMRALVESRVKPHYLHHGDLARGTSHFRVPIAKGQSLLRHMRGRVSGLCQPTYMLDLPGGYGKVPVGPVFASNDGEVWNLEDYHGHMHMYRDELDE